MAPAPLDALTLAQTLIRRPSVTPEDAGALDVLAKALDGLGFTVERLRFSASKTPDIDNLYARIGTGGPHFCFAGHTDVVPVGDPAGWTVDPFGGVVDQGYLLGRGASDMKTAIACFTAAAGRYLAEQGDGFTGSISLLITGDEEGPAVNGTVKVLETLSARGERWDGCVVGEPTNPHQLGEMAKLGRRGSLNGLLTVAGVAGHVAYPHLADNPIPKLLRLLAALDALELDQGTDHFQPSNLEIVTVDVGNSASNVIPSRAEARFNIRFNDRHSSGSLDRLLRVTLDATGLPYDLQISVSGEAFLTAPGRLSEILVAAVAAETGLTPDLSTSGGTSDARFIARYCPVIEFGMVGATMHKVDEKIPVADVARLERIYCNILHRFFA